MPNDISKSMEMSNKKFSIIVVTLNNADGLKRTLQSVSALHYPCFEVIVIDGASTDSTKTVVENFGELITVFVSEKDNGIYNAMNKGIVHATGDYSVFMNAGDCFATPDVLTTVSRFDADIILGGARYGDSDRPVPENMTLYDVLSLGINHQSIYYRTELLRKYGFDESYRLIADLKSVVEPMARDKATITTIPSILSICEGGGVSKQNWRDTLVENRRIVSEVIEPYYREDYLRFSRINNSMLNDFIVLSHFQSIFPLLRLLAKVMRFLNSKFKHIPL